MNKLILSTLFALCSRLWLVLGFVLLLGIVLFNSLVGSVDVGGWSSGFTHPLHGGDHFLTMLAVGIWAAQLRGKAIWLLPVTFVSVMSLGGLAGAAGLLISGAELIILLSCLVFSLLIVRKIRFSSHTNVIIVAFFAFFHGFAHGQEISTSASLISYTLGFMVATLLLHGAGILIVRLLIVIFALFISHLAYAQSSSKHLVVKIATTQIDKTHEFFMAVHPPDRQLLYSGEEGSGSHATIRQNQSAGVQKHVFGLSLVRVIYRASYPIASEWLSADWLDQQHLGILFLTSGVGETSPPVAMIFDSTPRFCFAAVFSHTADISANNGSQVSETTERFDLLNTYTLATSFLTNGVGATSPPVWRTASLNYHSATQSFITRQFRPLFSSNPLISQTRLKSRSPPFALPVNRVAHTVLPISSYKNNY